MKSLIALSMHKAGSSIADQIIEIFCIQKGYESDRISRKVPSSPLPEIEVFHNYQEHMKLSGVYYGIARVMETHNMGIIPKLRVIVQVRDPRDCITSAYFSFGKSHNPPDDPEKRKAFFADKERISNATIDDYAKRITKNYWKRLDILSRVLEKHDDILVLKYEDMVENTSKWLGDISSFLDQPLTEDLITKLGPRIDFTVPKEDEAQHKRQVRPGDHRRKLQPETISSMNVVLADVLNKFQYEM